MNIHTIELLVDESHFDDLKGKTDSEQFIMFGKYYKGQIKVKTNPNNAIKQEITDYETYKVVKEDIMEYITANNVKRVDFKYDFYYEYELNEKLISLIFSLIAHKHNFKNGIKTIGLKSSERRNVKVSDRFYEFEYYNKILQKPSEKVKTRLEIRHKFVDELDGTEPELKAFTELMQMIKGSLTKDNFESFLSSANADLIEEYKKHKGLYTNFNEFLANKQEFIFTRSQLIDLYEMNGSQHNSAKVQASVYAKKHYEFKLYKLSDLTKFQSKLHKTGLEFFFKEQMKMIKVS